ncbi:unnamed protein product, partial [marine sediment metagenome]
MREHSITKLRELLEGVQWAEYAPEPSRGSKRAAYKKAYRGRNKEERRTYLQDYQEKNKEKIAAY